MRLTRQQMAEKYPDRYLGITDIQYENNDGVTIESAEIIYTDKSEEELLTLQISHTFKVKVDSKGYYRQFKIKDNNGTPYVYLAKTYETEEEYYTGDK